LNACGAAAADESVKIQLEVHGEGTSRVPRIRKILDYADNHPAVRVCWNSNQEDLLDGGLERNFRLVQSQIGQVHMRDLFLEEYPWRSLIRLLNEIGFEGYCFAEIPPSADPLRVLKYFRATFQAHQSAFAS
jgi:Xylose isomerase-like TIM barrel